MNAPDLPYLTINWHFGAFCTIWVYSRPFGCLTKLGGKRAELVQKFVPRNHVGIFPNKRTRSTPLDSKLTFWCVFRTIWVHSGPFGCLMKLGGKRAELVQKSYHEIASEFFPTNAPDPLHWTLNWHYGAFRTIWVHPGPFGCLTKLVAKRADLVQKFVPRSCVGIFLQQTHPIHSIGP